MAARRKLEGTVKDWRHQHRIETHQRQECLQLTALVLESCLQDIATIRIEAQIIEIGAIAFVELIKIVGKAHRICSR